MSYNMIKSQDPNFKMPKKSQDLNFQESKRKNLFWSLRFEFGTYLGIEI